MRNKTYAIGLVIILFILSGCSALKNVGIDSAKELTGTLDDLTQKDSIYQISQAAVEGAINGLGSDDSSENIKKLSIALSETLGKELNDVLRSLDTKKPGNDFSHGVTEKLFSKEVEEQLELLVSKALKSADGDVNKAINSIKTNINNSLNNIFGTLNNNISGLEKTLVDAMSDRLKDSLSSFLTAAITDVDFSQASENISTQLLSAELKDSLKILVKDLVKAGKDEGDDLFDKIFNYAILLGIFLFCGGLIFYYFKNEIKESDNIKQDFMEIMDELTSNDEKMKEEMMVKLRNKNRLKNFKPSSNKPS